MYEHSAEMHRIRIHVAHKSEWQQKKTKNINLNTNTFSAEKYL